MQCHCGEGGAVSVAVLCCACSVIVVTAGKAVLCCAGHSDVVPELVVGACCVLVAVLCCAHSVSAGGPCRAVRSDVEPEQEVGAVSVGWVAVLPAF